MLFRSRECNLAFQVRGGSGPFIPSDGIDRATGFHMEGGVITRLRLAVGGLMLIALLGVAAANLSWAATLGVEVWDLPDLLAGNKTGPHLDRDLESEYSETRRRIAAKEEMVKSLIAGRSSLADVTAQFMVLNDGYEDHMVVVRMLNPGATDKEKMLWNVVGYVNQRLSDLPAWQRLAVNARLQTELQTLSSEFVSSPVN